VEIVTSWERKGIEKGRAEGRVEGRVEGRAEGLDALRAVLLDVLSVRFEPPVESVAKRIGQIDSLDDLRALTHRALSASSPGEIGF
jgi:predicted transposase YdaD